MQPLRTDQSPIETARDLQPVEEHILTIVAASPHSLTTAEISVALVNRGVNRCPSSVARSLSRLVKAGVLRNHQARCIGGYRLDHERANDLGILDLFEPEANDHGEGEEPERPLPALPTSALPGSEAKIAVLAERLAAGVQLFHPQDAIGSTRCPAVLSDRPRRGKGDGIVGVYVRPTANGPRFLVHLTRFRNGKNIQFYGGFFHTEEEAIAAVEALRHKLDNQEAQPARA